MLTVHNDFHKNFFDDSSEGTVLPSPLSPGVTEAVEGNSASLSYPDVRSSHLSECVRAQLAECLAGEGEAWQRVFPSTINSGSCTLFDSMFGCKICVMSLLVTGDLSQWAES